MTGAVLDFLDVSIRFTVDEGEAAGAFTVEVVRPGLGKILPQPAVIGAWAVEKARVYTAVTQLSARHDRSRASRMCDGKARDSGAR